MSKPIPTILGYGYSLPSGIRKNHDPIFDWLRHHHTDGDQLFEGYKERRVLGPGEDLMTIMVPASLNAIKDANIDKNKIDFLLGIGSISEYRNPNVLSKLHRDLGLSESCWPIPTSDSFSNFNSSLIMADALIRSGRANYVLICIGGNWTRNVNYRTPQAISAADGAAAVIVGQKRTDRGDSWSVIDTHTITDSTYYGSMFTDGICYDFNPPHDGQHCLWGKHEFQITSKGLEGFKSFGVNQPPKCVVQLLKRHNLKGSDICLISHQASATLTDAWNNVIQPAQYINTIEKFANMALANVPVNLAWSAKHEPVTNDFLVLLTIGPDMHTNALLLKKS